MDTLKAIWEKVKSVHAAYVSAVVAYPTVVAWVWPISLVVLWWVMIG